jgi:hypothetical protein
MKNLFFHFWPPPGVKSLFLFPSRARFLGGKEKDGRRGKSRWKALDMSVWSGRIHASGVQGKWLLSSDPGELLNVFSLPEIKCCNFEWMTVWLSFYQVTGSPCLQNRWESGSTTSEHPWRGRKMVKTNSLWLTRKNRRSGHLYPCTKRVVRVC